MAPSGIVTLRSPCLLVNIPPLQSHEHDTILLNDSGDASTNLGGMIFSEGCALVDCALTPINE